MKRQSLLTFLLAALLWGCSDNDAPTASCAKYPSFIKAFRETYTFCSRMVSDSERDSLIIPVHGAVSRTTVDYTPENTIRPDYDHPYTIGDGVEYSASTPLWFNRWLIHYGDTACRQSDLPDDYRPHPYGIVSITMELLQTYFDMFLPPYVNEVYNKNYPVGDCTSLFRIRYRTYYDYIRNGYSWREADGNDGWKEMDLTEFNTRQGDRLMDMKEFYLIAREKPWRQFFKTRNFRMIVTFEDGRTNRYYDNNHPNIIAYF